ncbi:MAG: carboxypeptidase regulatory-like domain-containing protein [Bacteroidaceae bacterium]|nr:carboxypeptidase regulatory-like domain-containing protein [Bacteroidaceae bacterium]
MKKFFLMVVAAMMAAMNVNAQRIQVVDSDGNPIPLVTVLNEDGTMIGTTNLEGVFEDLQGVAKVTVTHVAFKSRQVNVADLADGRITMEDADYSLAEIVVKPKPFIYVETFYRAYVYREDSLVYFKCGIMPNAYDPKKKKMEHGSLYQARTEYAPTMGFAVNWGSRIDLQKPGQVRLFPTDKSMKEKYLVEATQKGDGKEYSNADGIVGRLVSRGNQARMTLDGGKMQMYVNRVKGQTKMLKKREEKEYEYKFTLIHNSSEDGYGLTSFVMSTDHWEFTDKKSHVTMVVEAYATAHGYMDKAEFKDKKKEIKEEHKSATLESLEAYAAAHGVPALSSAVRQAVNKLKHW